ncbi:hypothetical protein V6N13_065802 [Hibiscus sabdariffa]
MIAALRIKLWRNHMNSIPTSPKLQLCIVHLTRMGLGCLSKNRRRRPAKLASQLNQSVLNSIATTSKYNLIFVENDPVVETSTADITPASDIQPAPPTPVPNQDIEALLHGNYFGLDIVLVPNGKSKLKGKNQVVPHKSSPLFLKQRDTNIIPRKSSSGVSSTTSASKKLSLGPSKHLTLTTSVSAPLIVINHGRQQQGPSYITDAQSIWPAHGGTTTIIPNPTNKVDVQSDGHPIMLH